ncbi:WG repeat-containing protein [Blautia schinkii]|nr:WG repeat-containing protein [Blautia schinkii]
MKKLVIAAVFLLFVLACVSTADTSLEKPAEYKKCLLEAEKFEEKEIYYDAVLAYKEALNYAPESMEIHLKIAENYRNLRDADGFEDACNAAIDLGGDNDKAIFMLTDYYLEEDRKEDAISLLKRQIETKRDNGAVVAKLNSLAGGFRTLSGEYENISSTCGGYMFVEKEEVFGILDAVGKEMIRPQYEAVGLFGSNGFAPVKKDGAWYYIDSNNYKRRAPDEKYEFLGVLNQGVIPAEKEGKWGYLNEDFKMISEFIYEDVTPMLDNMAAVKKDGKWALVGKDLKPITDFGFDDIVRDDWGFCSRNSVVFAAVGEEYKLINSDGVQIGESYDKAAPFVSGKPAAVKQAGKWGFVSAKGEKVLECLFQKARSFSSIGYAPVSDGEKWGYIKSNGDYVIEPEFDGAKAFNSKGIAPVKLRGVWQLIQLDIY